jgi:hypothetical protein
MLSWMRAQQRAWRLFLNGNELTGLRLFVLHHLHNILFSIKYQ